RFDPLEALRTSTDILLVNQAIANEDMEKAVGESRIRAGHEAQMKTGSSRRRRGARINCDQLTSEAALLLNVLHHGRHSFRDVTADQEDYFGLRYVLQGKWQSPVDAKGSNRSCCCR